MKKVLLSICLLLVACTPAPEEKKVVVKKQETEWVATPPPAPAPNPFEKAPAAPPAPVHEVVQQSHWDPVGGEFKLNDSWSVFTWQDTPNHNICYFYNVFAGDNHVVIGHGMSCIKE
jgi:hypothetical protein